MYCKTEEMSVEASFWIRMSGQFGCVFPVMSLYVKDEPYEGLSGLSSTS